MFNKNDIQVEGRFAQGVRLALVGPSILLINRPAQCLPMGDYGWLLVDYGVWTPRRHRISERTLRRQSGRNCAHKLKYDRLQL